MCIIQSHIYITIQRYRKIKLTARDASSGVENATNPEPLLIPLGSRITCEILREKRQYRKYLE